MIRMDSTQSVEFDPHPDPHDLFVLYNGLYFRSSLGACSVEWSSKKMVRCAGTCSYHKGGAAIRLSEPLLKFRPAIDLKETLLHEMIHAYVYLGGKSRADGDHGLLFQQIAHEINTAAFPDPERPPQGYHVSKYHTFLAEVKHYQTHHWECDRCGKLISRSMHRPPQEADCMHYRKHVPYTCDDASCRYHAHLRTCGGTYVKVGEPDGCSDKRKGKGKRKQSGEQPKFARNGEPLPAKRPRTGPDPPAGNTNILDFFNRIPKEDPGAGPSSPPPPPRPPAQKQPQLTRRINDSPATKRKLLAEAAERRAQAAAQAQDQAPATGGIGGACAGQAANARSRRDDIILLDDEEQPPSGFGAGASSAACDVAAAAAASRSGSGDAEGKGKAAWQGGSADTEHVAVVKSEAAQGLSCPICSRRWSLEEMSNAQLNAHIDACLLGGG